MPCRHGSRAVLAAAAWDAPHLHQIRSASTLHVALRGSERTATRLSASCARWQRRRLRLQQRPSVARASSDAALTFFTGARAAARSRSHSCSTNSSSCACSRKLPGLRRGALRLRRWSAASGNRFVLERYTARARCACFAIARRAEVIHLPSLTAEDTLMSPTCWKPRSVKMPSSSRAPCTPWPTDGRRTCKIAGSLRQMREAGGPGADDAVSAPVEQMWPAPHRPCVQLLLRTAAASSARGYGALCDSRNLADEEG